jgi:hypothetical protein
MKLVTPHFRAWRGTGSRSLFVLFNTLAHHLLIDTIPDLPSSIALCKSRLGLLDTKCKVGFLEHRHCRRHGGVERMQAPLYPSCKGRSARRYYVTSLDVRGQVTVEISLTKYSVEFPSLVVARGAPQPLTPSTTCSPSPSRPQRRCMAVACYAMPVQLQIRNLGSGTSGYRGEVHDRAVPHTSCRQLMSTSTRLIVAVRIFEFELEWHAGGFEFGNCT